MDSDSEEDGEDIDASTAAVMNNIALTNLQRQAFQGDYENASSNIARSTSHHKFFSSEFSSPVESSHAEATDGLSNTPNEDVLASSFAFCPLFKLLREGDVGFLFLISFLTI